MTTRKAKVIGNFEPLEGDDLIRANELKKNEGRHSIAEAMQRLKTETGKYFALHKAVESGDIKSYAPGDDRDPIVCEPHQRNMDEEIYWDEVITWIALTFPRFKYPAAPETAPVPTPTPEKRKAERKTIKSVAWDYLMKEFKNGQYATAKEFYKGLELKSGQDDSPFEKGTGSHAFGLFVRDISKPMSLKTLANYLGEIRTESRLT